MTVLAAAWAALAAAPKPASSPKKPEPRPLRQELRRKMHAVEEETPWGFSAHYLGPAEAEGAWRAALGVHFVQKDRPGFVPLEEALKRERQGDRLTGREATAIRRVRVARGAARRFEVTETRQLPAGGDGYFILKLSTTRETYLDYRDDFERLLEGFRILGYP